MVKGLGWTLITYAVGPDVLVLSWWQVTDPAATFDDDDFKVR